MPSTEWKKYINTQVTSLNADKIAKAISEAPLEHDEKETNSLGEICLSLGIYQATAEENYVKAFDLLILARSFLNSTKIQYDWVTAYIAFCCIHINDSAMCLHYSDEIIKKYSHINNTDNEITKLLALAYFSRAFSCIDQSSILSDFNSAIELYENIALSDSSVLDNVYADIMLNYANYLSQLETSNPTPTDFVESFKNKKNNYENLNSTHYENPAHHFEKLEKDYWSKRETSHSHHAKKFHFYYGEYLYKKSQQSNNSNSILNLSAAFVQFQKAKSIDDNLIKDTGKESKLSLNIQNKVTELKSKLKSNSASRQHSRSLTLSEKKPLGFWTSRNRSNSVTSYGSCDTTPREHKEDKPLVAMKEFNPFKNC